jgi:hypothetical protein
MIVMIQPSYGNPAARHHWRDTLDQPVPFSKPPYRDTLTPVQLESLLELHPD